MSKGQGTLAQRKRTAGRRGEKAGSLDPRVSKGGGRNDWALSSRETMRKRRVRTKWGRLAVGNNSSEEHRSCIDSGWRPCIGTELVSSPTHHR